MELGRVVAARFVRFSIPKDIADAYGAVHSEEEGGVVELVVRAKRRGAVSITGPIRDALAGDESRTRCRNSRGTSTTPQRSRSIYRVGIVRLT